MTPRKRAFCDKLLLNLNIKDREIRSVSWKKPVSDWPKSPKILIGGAKRECLEPYFTRLWRSIGHDMDDRQKNGLISLAEALNQNGKLKDRLCTTAGVGVDGS